MLKCAVAVVGESDKEFLRQSRKWDVEQWSSAEEELRERGWLGEDGHLTTAGTLAHEEVEAETDAVAARPWTALGADATARLAHLLEPLARTVLHSGVVPDANPVGLTPGT
ncbi:hypothetical protein OG352_01950 [Streptomyces sp. NBC_01485]|uniref:helix-turn-helix domain-containing protein n=1 Tax=Streptomyces sp. NBC_01485 TaxID=2903884 RepID=UPI002E3108A3|nr:hypothetical protein [Streptomyces sp. NBC_01485]